MRPDLKLRVTLPKLIALAITIAWIVAMRNSGHLMFAALMIWFLTLIWFPEYWGNYMGWMSWHRVYIDQQTPPVVVAVAGWLLLIGFMLLVYWMDRAEFPWPKRQAPRVLNVCPLFFQYRVSD